MASKSVEYIVCWEQCLYYKIILSDNLTLLGASVPNNIEFVANSTLLGASVPNNIEFDANSTLLGANCHQSDELIPELLGAVRR